MGESFWRVGNWASWFWGELTKIGRVFLASWELGELASTRVNDVRNVKQHLNLNTKFYHLYEYNLNEVCFINNV